MRPNLTSLQRQIVHVFRLSHHLRLTGNWRKWDLALCDLSKDGQWLVKRQTVTSEKTASDQCRDDRWSAVVETVDGCHHTADAEMTSGLSKFPG